jgi:gluconolactonase
MTLFRLRSVFVALSGICCALLFSASGEAEELFVATPLTKPGGFTRGIEGPACDASGNIYAVNFERQQTIGMVTPDGRAEVFLTLPGLSSGNSIRFTRDGTMLVADVIEHNIFRVDMKTRAVSVLAHDDRMNQPNDLTLAPDETIYASDPNWKEKTGQLWRIDRDGSTHLVATGLGTTNGLAVSPDGRTLYVNEHVQRGVWAFPIHVNGTLGPRRLIRQFDDFGFDGMRCDIDGNLYITRVGGGTVLKLSPAGEILREVDVLGAWPSNLCFGGPDGRTAYVTEAEQRRFVQFRVDRPGLEWQQQRK